MYITDAELLTLGVSKETLDEKIENCEWHVRTLPQADNEKEILVSSLPQKLQLAWAKSNSVLDYPEQLEVLLSEAAEYGLDKEASARLTDITPAERLAWMREALRMVRVVDRYSRINPKRQRNSAKGRWTFVAAVNELCAETACKDWRILARQPHRSEKLSPHTLDGLYRSYRRRGFVAFLPKVKKKSKRKIDRRRVDISQDAIKWVNQQWRRFSGPRPLYNALKKEAAKRGWRIPSESWVNRLWYDIPEVVKVYYLEGKQAYESKLAPYVPRDYSDLRALQVLCGDHSERDVTVLLPDHSLTRPWLTLWYDLRCNLIWGWCLSLVPSSFTAGLAYADGVQNFGAQPIARPADGFYSYIYTDRGRDYRSHKWDGQVIAVHKEAMNPEGGLEMLLMQRRIGILEELQLRHILAKGRNPKEKPVERVFRIFSDWEQNTFKEYCGRDPKSRPERWQELYAQHQFFLKGKRAASPFMPIDAYREALAEFITRYNYSAHECSTLGSARIIPIEEYKRLYTTRYEIAPETLTLLLMNTETRVIRKNGVQCFQKHWFYYHEAMSLYKGKSVEVRYSDGDYNRVWVVLPDMRLCEAHLIAPTSLLNPNKQTLNVVRQARAEDRRVQREYDLINQRRLRGETTEERVARQIEADNYVEQEADTQSEDNPPTGRVYHLTRLDRRKLKHRSEQKRITGEMIAATKSDDSIFDQPESVKIKEFEYDE